MRIPSHRFRTLILVLCLLFVSPAAWGWGEWGHSTIGFAMSFLLPGPLGSFYRRQKAALGYLNTIPDTWYRDLPQEDKAGTTSHEMNPKKMGYATVADVPLNFQQIATTNHKTPTEVAEELGSLWWRADQFYRLAVKDFSDAKAALPADASTGGPTHGHISPSKAYTDAVFQALTHTGILGHWVGDNAMPWHNTDDYNGVAAGHAGIHALYETGAVNEMGPDLLDKVVQQAKVDYAKMQADLKEHPKSVLEMMKEGAIWSTSQLDELYKLDPIVVPVDAEHQRPKRDSSKLVAAFGDHIVQQMAYASALYAVIVEKAYEAGGSPDLSVYHSFRYPHTPDYIAPDYLTDCKEASQKVSGP